MNLSDSGQQTFPRKQEGRPLPTDYKNYALNIIQKYPFLGQSVTKRVEGKSVSIIPCEYSSIWFKYFVPSHKQSLNNEISKSNIK